MTSLSRLLRILTAPNKSIIIFCIFVSATYVLFPLLLYIQVDTDEGYLELAQIALVSILAITFGGSVSIFDFIFTGKLQFIKVSGKIFIWGFWLLFFLFAVLVISTAPQLPILAAVSGADPDVLAILREQFLKAREGWQSILVYFNALITGAIIPYAIGLMFVHGLRYRWFFLGVFLTYCISYLEKAFFFRALLPLFFLSAQGRISTYFTPFKIILLSIIIIIVGGALSGAGSIVAYDNLSFFSIHYIPQSNFEHLIWRIFVVPMATAVDGIVLFNSELKGQHFFGATSSLLSWIFGLERIEFERMVFESQWGQNETQTGSSNSVYFVEAFINFGWLGVLMFGIIVGLIFRYFSLCRDSALQALWPLFSFGIYTSGLIGILFSNGFLFILFFGIFVRVKFPKTR